MNAFRNILYRGAELYKESKGDKNLLSALIELETLNKGEDFLKNYAEEHFYNNEDDE